LLDVVKMSLGCFGLFWAVLGCFGLFWAVLGCFGLFCAVLCCFGQFWAVLGSFGQFETLLGFRRSKRGSLGLFGALWPDLTGKWDQLDPK
jgi:hypothetical protein